MNKTELLLQCGAEPSAELESKGIRLIPCYAATATPPSSESDEVQSHLGGTANLPDGTLPPVDRNGRAMALLGRIEFSELPPVDDFHFIPRSGCLYWFINTSLDFSNVKDRFNFATVWINSPIPRMEFGHSFFPEQTIRFVPSLQPVGNLAASTTIGSLVKETEHRIFGQLNEEDLLREKCAFAANGISWSPSRRQDSCYAHLVDAAKSWRLLWCIPWKLLGVDTPSNSNSNLALYIRQEDLMNCDFKKAWMVKS